PWLSSTIRTARSRSSGEYLVDVFIAPSSQGLEPPENPGRFRLVLFRLLAGLWGVVSGGLSAPKTAPSNRSFKPNPLRLSCMHARYWDIVLYRLTRCGSA